MIKPEYIEWIHQEIDNEISPENKNKLQAYLTTHKEAAKFYQELINSARLLEHMPAVEPPQNLSKRILNSLNFNLYAEKVKAYSNAIKLIDSFVKPNPKPAYAFAIGLIMGLIVYALVIMLIFQEQPIDFADIYGIFIEITDNECCTARKHATRNNHIILTHLWPNIFPPNKNNLVDSVTNNQCGLAVL